MNRMSVIAWGLTAGALVAQTPEPGKTVIRESRSVDIRINGPEGATAGPIMMFSSREGGAVKGAPYSADTVTETVQALADGNRITRQNKSSFYRDSEGRTRREHSIQGFGPLGQSKEPMVTITIDDPVAKTHYVLDTKGKTAQKMTMPGMPPGIPPGMAGELANMAIRRPFPGGAPGANADVIFERIAPGPGAMGSATVMAWTHSTEERRSANVKNEDLGLRTIEGVAAKGTRHTLTIPAGEVGNERPIEVVTETWYSDQLKTAVLTIHKDPRFGETTTKLVNVRLGDPPRNVFEVPAEYKVNEGPAMFEIRRDAPVRVKEILEEI